MYAIIRTGGKQYKVQPGDVLRVEKINQDLGSEFDLTDVLMVGGDNQAEVGQPALSGAKVRVVVTRQDKDSKVIIFKKKRRQGYRRFKGHRQPFTELFVKSITVGGKTDKTDREAKIVDMKALRAEKMAAKSSEKTDAVAKEAKKTKKAKAPAKKKAVVKKKTAKKKASGAKKTKKR